MYTRNDGHIIVNQLCESEGESLSHVRLCHPMNYTAYSSWNSPGQNRGVGSLSLLQGIFTTQESNWGLLHCRRILYQLSYEGSPNYTSIKKKKEVKLEEQASRWHNEQAAHYCQTLVSFQTQSWPLS